MKLYAIDVHLATDGLLRGAVVVVLQHQKPGFNLADLLYSHSVTFNLQI